MALAGTLKGIGTIIAGNTRHDNVAYDLTVSSNGTTRTGAGAISLASPREAFIVMNYGSFTLELKSGKTMALMGVHYDAPGTAVKVRTTGPIPGF